MGQERVIDLDRGSNPSEIFRYRTTYLVGVICCKGATVSQRWGVFELSHSVWVLHQDKIYTFTLKLKYDNTCQIQSLISILIQQKFTQITLIWLNYFN